MTIQCYNSVRLQTLIRPAFDTYVSAGFPSPADDYLEIKLDLNDLGFCRICVLEIKRFLF